MIRRDFIEAEIHKLAEALARIIGLKNEGKLDEAIEVSQETLAQNFAFDNTFIENTSVDAFETDLKSRNYSAEKLNILAQLLFESAYPFQDTDECKAVMHKVALILNLLETAHHQQSFENLSRREMIDKFLNNQQYE